MKSPQYNMGLKYRSTPQVPEKRSHVVSSTLAFVIMFLGWMLAQWNLHTSQQIVNMQNQQIIMHKNTIACLEQRLHEQDNRVRKLKEEEHQHD
jgi:hypothetical protein